MKSLQGKNLTLLIKPVSSSCNLRCRYCFYEDLSNHRQIKNKGIMKEDTVKEILFSAKEIVQSHGFLQIVFQGGEPTLASLSFFEYFLKSEQQANLSKFQTSHSIQTNGILLDEHWAKFFHQNHFLVGISIDGSAQCHDLFRIDSGGKGTWKQVSEKVKFLQSYQVECNLLCVVHSLVAHSAQEIYESLCQFKNMPLQFIPCLDPLDQKDASFSLSPQDYGKFLCEIFDLWYEDITKGIYRSVRFIDDYLRIILGMDPTNCALLGQCGSYIVIEADGSLYPCDFFVLDSWELGNIHTHSLQNALLSDKNQAFIKEGTLQDKQCQTCSYSRYCRGGCQKERVHKRTIYCEAYQQFFAHALPRLYLAARYLTSHTS